MSPRPDDPETAKTLETTRGAPLDVPLVLPDGVSLHARLWCPSEGPGPWPALLMRQPYGHAIASTVTYAHPSWWASHGFLVVVQDVRGQGASGGTFGGFAQERADTSATLTWIRNLAACNGRVGLYGFSYQGFTQLVAEPDSDPPNCLAPAMTGLNERDHWICEQVGPELRRRGVLFAGLDVIGDYLTEINVTSPTCIRELDHIYGLNISGQLFDCIESLR